MKWKNDMEFIKWCNRKGKVNRFRYLHLFFITQPYNEQISDVMNSLYNTDPKFYKSLIVKNLRAIEGNSFSIVYTLFMMYQ